MLTPMLNLLLGRRLVSLRRVLRRPFVCALLLQRFDASPRGNESHEVRLHDGFEVLAGVRSRGRHLHVSLTVRVRHPEPVVVILIHGAVGVHDPLSVERVDERPRGVRGVLTGPFLVLHRREVSGTITFQERDILGVLVHVEDERLELDAVWRLGRLRATPVRRHPRHLLLRHVVHERGLHDVAGRAAPLKEVERVVMQNHVGRVELDLPALRVRRRRELGGHLRILDDVNLAVPPGEHADWLLRVGFRNHLGASLHVS
mmetsp:Transcript_7839/g.35583  ORF Transcript_7839/g.35583 Transcript_7839/m.35583 type:complete len:259 (+) Transcript_7839:1007-1783(+)